MPVRDIKKLVAAIAISEFAGVLGALFTAPSVPSWYAGLAKPSFAPPNWVFGPVWTALYALMGVASFIIWRHYDHPAERRTAKWALGIFDAQLLLNVLWSALFFGAQSIGGAVLEIIFLWLAIIGTIAAFGRISRTAAYLLVPYLAWVSFAAYLNWILWILN